jgi:type II secretory pathway pseudopilin PulG
LTLIEILVVIGVIAILAGIAVYGFKALANNANRNKTKVVLVNCGSLLKEYETATGMKSQPPYKYDPGGVQKTANFDIWRDADADLAGPEPEAMQVPVGDFSADLVSSTNLVRRNSVALKNTAVVLREAIRVPNLKNWLTQLPDGTVADTRVQPSADPKEQIQGEPNAIMLLDGWKNPIIYVPASGLDGVMLGGTTDPYVVRSDKVYTRAAFNAAVTGNRLPVGRPFFASAGPDGDFSKGDDNLYSFQN